MRWHQTQHARLLINGTELPLLMERNSFWVGGGETVRLFTSPLRADQMSPAGTSLLGTTALAKLIENNGKQWRWIQSDVIKSRKMSLYTPVLKPFHAASCLSVSPGKKIGTEQARIFRLMSSPDSHHGCGGTKKNESGISDSTWSGECCPNSLGFHPSTIDYRDHWKTWQPLEFHFNAATVKSRPTGSLCWPPTPSFLQGKGSFVCISHAVSDVRVIPGPTLSSAGFHKSWAAAAMAVTVTTTENVIYSKLWNTVGHKSWTGTRLCRHHQGQWLKVKPQICHTMIKKANLSHPNSH